MRKPKTVTVRITRSDGQWVAKVLNAKNLFSWSPSLERLRGHVEAGLQEFFPDLAKLPRREVIVLPQATKALLKDLAKAERETSRRLRSNLCISIREVGDLMGISGSRAQQLLGK
jgi:hypothetical protein